MVWLRTWIVLLALTAPALAVQPDEVLTDARLETRARALSQELRCMVCQNQSIDDSDAPLARDLRILVRERLVAGNTDREVLDFLVERYGDFVLLKPPFNMRTALLWLLPPALVGLGLAILLVGAYRHRRPVAGAGALTAEERARLEKIINN